VVSTYGEGPAFPLGDFWLPRGLAVAHPGPAVSSHESGDFWLSHLLQPASESGSSGPVDFWLDGLGVAQSTMSSTADDTWHDVHLPWFDGQLATHPPSVPSGARQPETMARRRARWLVQLLDEPATIRRTALRAYFEELFIEFPAPQTFRALAALAVDGAGGDALLNASEFKRWVLADRTLLARRVVGGEYFFPPSGSASLISWARCFRLGSYCGGDNPADHFEPGWFDDWLEIAPGDGNSSWFIDYFEQRLRAKHLGYWDVVETAPRRRAPVFEGGVEAWCRSAVGRLVFSIPDHLGVINQERRGLVVAQYGRGRVGTAGNRVLG
jgi:hypothetical protein